MPGIKLTNKIRVIFLNFVEREGTPRHLAAQELNEHLTSNGMILTRDAYLSARRTGSPLVLGNRAARLALWQLLQNAVNHATFEQELAA